MQNANTAPMKGKLVSIIKSHIYGGDFATMKDEWRTMSPKDKLALALDCIAQGIEVEDIDDIKERAVA